MHWEAIYLLHNGFEMPVPPKIFVRLVHFNQIFLLVQSDVPSDDVALAEIPDPVNHKDLLRLQKGIQFCACPLLHGPSVVKDCHDDSG